MTAPSTPENVSLHLRDLRGKPHAEVVIIKRDTEGRGAVGICYNTLSLPDHLSDEQFRALDADALKAEFGGDGIWLNGPRRAQMDEASAEVLDDGRVTSVGGIPMQTVAKVRIPDVRCSPDEGRPTRRRKSNGPRRGCSTPASRCMN